MTVPPTPYVHPVHALRYVIKAPEFLSLEKKWRAEPVRGAGMPAQRLFEAASARDCSSDIPMSANTSLLSVAVALYCGPPEVGDHQRGTRPSVGCGVRSTRPPASSRRMACVTLVTLLPWSNALVMGNAPVGWNTQQSQQLVARSSDRRAAARFSTPRQRNLCARITDVTATMPSATSPQPDAPVGTGQHGRLSDSGGTPLLTPSAAGAPKACADSSVQRSRHRTQHRAGR